MATDQMCMAKSTEGICEMPAGHDGEHEWSPAPPGVRLPAEELDAAVEAATNADEASAASVAETDGVVAPAPAGMVTLRDADVETLLNLGFANASVADLDSDDLALLARVKRAREQA